MSADCYRPRERRRSESNDRSGPGRDSTRGSSPHERRSRSRGRSQESIGSSGTPETMEMGEIRGRSLSRSLSPYRHPQNQSRSPKGNRSRTPSPRRRSDDNRTPRRSRSEGQRRENSKIRNRSDSKRRGRSLDASCARKSNPTNPSQPFQSTSSTTPAGDFSFTPDPGKRVLSSSRRTGCK